MTIEKAIDQADNLRPNAFTQMQKVEWLSRLDNQVFEEVLLMARKNWKYDSIVETISGTAAESFLAAISGMTGGTAPDEMDLRGTGNFLPGGYVRYKKIGSSVEVESEDRSRIIPAIEFEPYDETTPLETELLVDDLYAGCYIDYLISKYDLYNRETQMYNNSVLVFNSNYQEYVNWYRRNNKPVRKKVRRI